MARVLAGLYPRYSRREGLLGDYIYVPLRRYRREIEEAFIEAIADNKCSYLDRFLNRVISPEELLRRARERWG